MMGYFGRWTRKAKSNRSRRGAHIRTAEAQRIEESHAKRRRDQVYLKRHRTRAAICLAYVMPIYMQHNNNDDEQNEPNIPDVHADLHAEALRVCRFGAEARLADATEHLFAAKWMRWIGSEISRMCDSLSLSLGEGITHVIWENLEECIV